MNNNRRKEIDVAVSKLEALKEAWEDAKEAIETIKEDEEEYFQNMPESLQSSERGNDSENSIEQLNAAYDAMAGIEIDDIISNLQDAK